MELARKGSEIAQAKPAVLCFKAGPSPLAPQPEQILYKEVGEIGQAEAGGGCGGRALASQPQASP